MRVGKFIIRRVISGVVGFILIIFMYSVILNTQLDVTAEGQIQEMVKGIIQGMDLRGKTFEEVREIRADLIRGLESHFDLDKPLLGRIFSRAYKAMFFNFGDAKYMRASIKYQNSPEVKFIILEALPATLLLFGATTTISVLIAIWLGIKKAQYANSFFDRATSILTMVFYGTPSWWMASLLIVIFVYFLDLLPFGSMYSSPPPDGALMLLLDRIWHMLLPLLSVILIRFWGSAYLIKNIMLDPMQQDFVMAARGRGIPENRVLFGHVLRTASPGIVTMSVMAIVNAIGGDILLEWILAWPGIGKLFWTATLSNDIPVMMGILTLFTILFSTAVVLLDIVYVYLDPRIKY